MRNVFIDKKRQQKYKVLLRSHLLKRLIIIYHDNYELLNHISHKYSINSHLFTTAPRMHLEQI